MKTYKQILIALLIVAFTTAGTYYVTQYTAHREKPRVTPTSRLMKQEVDFVEAARLVTPAVVHVNTVYETPVDPYALFRMDGQTPVRKGSGSGVLISTDGYIATNNHVIEDATAIEVILPDRRVFSANLVGRDPNTDLALLKIKGKDFPIIDFGDSDLLEVGEWVLAIGYPFSLNTTVTAGIVSAKGRSIGIINSGQSGIASEANTAIESFIQTDAAINPGNSGGALVNISGELIGINTAIASMTGSYAGYAFAIPVTLAKKILDDLKQYGKVKRGVLGVSFPAPSAEDAYLKQQGISPGSITGVIVMDILPKSAAANSGLKEGDILQGIDGISINSSADFSERIARLRPGDTVKLDYLRNGKKNSTIVTLESEEAMEKANGRSREEIYQRLGATFAPLSLALKQRLELNGGVVVTQVFPGGFFSQIGIPTGTIIAYINGHAVNTPDDIEKILMGAGNSRVKVFAIAPDGSRVVFELLLGA
ncbi:trypsin-like peptidase domain-containing protein [Pedobacter sp.]|uniref:trypsin-like peptidase domain-containing protein n=1 Tax=Pedobacter sp. TaxID=1411316 RepID=UPI003D7F9A3D